MFPKKLRKRLVVFLCVLMGLIAAAWGAARFMLPSAITIRSGERAALDFNLPMGGGVLCENMAVSAVNDKPVGDNIYISLGKPFTLKAESSGRAVLRMSFCGIPIKESAITVLPDTELIPLGQAVGLKMNTDGILVLGTGEVRAKDGRYISPCKGLLKSGDLIKTADNTLLTDKESLIDYVEKSGDKAIALRVERGGEAITVRVKPVVSSDSGKRKLGVWVRDSTGGIGTVTCRDKKGNFYALGHPVNDVDTGELMKIKEGKIMTAHIASVNKGVKGSPGELVGSFDKNKVIGEVDANTPCGIFGRLTENKGKNNTPLKIALKGEVKEGKAAILACVDGQGVKAYSINIERANTLSMDKSKAMVIRITDGELIEKTGGIVQGMSGAPIIQNGRLVGAVTHVFIQDPTKGYGIYIEDMIKERERGE